MKYICTKQNDGPDGEPGVEEMFLFPNHLKFAVIIELLNVIRNQSFGNWKRIKRPLLSEGIVSLKDGNVGINVIVQHTRDSIDQHISELFKKQIHYGCKYIVVAGDVDDSELEGSNPIKEIYIFPKDIHHDCFYEAINNQDEYREIVSAGFVDSDLNCHGSSETLGVKSRPEDTKLLKKEMLI